MKPGDSRADGNCVISGVSCRSIFKRLALSFPLLAAGGCEPEWQTLRDAVEGVVIFARESIPDDEIQRGVFITIGVSPDEGLPVVEVWLEVPREVELLHTLTFAVKGAGLHITNLRRNPEPEAAHWFGGELPPGKGQAFTAEIRFPGAQAGDVLSFPVELVLSDSSVVRWAGPPGSERPAPTIVVTRSLPRVGALVGSVIAGVALLVLVMAGLFIVRQRWAGHSGTTGKPDK